MENSAGTALRDAREASGLTVDDVALRLKLPARYVHALESDDVAALPEPTFVRGYVRAYARLLRLDEESLLASCARVEIRAPRPLVGPDGVATAPSKLPGARRAPSFRVGGPSRIRPHHWLAGAALAAVAAFWVAGGREGDMPSVPAEPVPAVARVPAAGLPVPATDAATVPGTTTLALPLPGSVSAAPNTSSTSTAPAAMPAAGETPALTATGSPVAASPAPAAVPVAEAPVPRKGLFLRFSGTSWLEVRDADNVVLHTRIEMAGSEVSLDGKAPFTVTLGASGSAQVWYNGDRVKPDRIASTGVARLIVGRPAR